MSSPRLPDPILAWYFVIVWGSGFIATKTGLQYAPPFTFLCLRFGLSALLMLPIVLVAKSQWPGSRAELGHVVTAGLLMHAVNLGGSHYAQYLGMSAGVTALILSVQPLLNAKVDQKRLGHAFSIHGVSGNIGWALAPMFMAPVMAMYGWRVALLAAGAIGVIFTAWIMPPPVG